jgi:hypothetical protein
VVHTQTLLPGGTVVWAVHDNGAVRPVLRHGINVVCTPILQGLVLVRGRDAQVFVLRQGVRAHAQNQARGRAQDDDQWVRGRVTEKGFPKAVGLIACLRRSVYNDRRRERVRLMSDLRRFHPSTRQKNIIQIEYVPEVVAWASRGQRRQSGGRPWRRLCAGSWNEERSWWVVGSLRVNLFRWRKDWMYEMQRATVVPNEERDNVANENATSARFAFLYARDS